jgi:hypothetical protein
MRCCVGGREVENKYTETLLNRDDDDKNADDYSGSFRLIIRTSLFFQSSNTRKRPIIYTSSKKTPHLRIKDVFVRRK